MRTTTILLATLLFATALASPAVAQEKEGSVFIPSEQELDEEQTEELKSLLTKEVTAALKQCVAKYPSPEHFTEVVTDYVLKKSGKLTGGYIGGAAPDPNLYVKSAEEREKLEKDGSFTRKVVQNDRDLERCMKKQTGRQDSGLDRYSADITATFAVTWKGKNPKVETTNFQVTKTK